ncbi:nicotinate phosphoribosyltransferase [candidate division WOR-3 bacterium]|nr:nicotinate phosphoribosyltransferase [candidate division WOR-3 bacterium]
MQIHANHKEILNGKTTDIYFHRTEEILKKEKKNPYVVAEVCAKKLPDKYKWAIFTGLSELIELFKDKKIDIKALPEGSVFFEKEPVLTIKGKYLDFAKFETPLLGYICQASGISTKAARCKIEADNRTVLSFGARRMHPCLTPVIDRYAYIGGVDGVSAVLSAEKLKLEPKGTIPHAVILIIGDTVKAGSAYDKAIAKGIPRTILVDTFGDEKTESLRLAENLQDRLDSIRVDTPSSRRGNLPSILQEIREELNNRGFPDIGIFVSGGLDEYCLKALNPYADGYGIGTSLSNAPTINFSLDIIEIEGKLVAKKGKVAGEKEVLECERCGNRKTVFFRDSNKNCDCGSKMKEVTKQIMKKGKVLAAEELDVIRDRVLRELRFLNV